jgi:hypothetical protein
MEILLSPHLLEDTFKVMRTSYNIYSSFGFIGFCVIYHSEKTVQAHLLLFETVSLGKPEEDHLPDTGKNYPLKTADADIIKDLMSSAIPTLGKNGLKYVASNGQTTYEIE